MLVVCGLNKLASLTGCNRTDFSKHEITNEQNGNETKSSITLKTPPKATTWVLHKVLVLAVFMIIGLFCWKVVVRNRVWSSRETLFRYV